MLHDDNLNMYMVIWIIKHTFLEVPTQEPSKSKRVKKKKHTHKKKIAEKAIGDNEFWGDRTLRTEPGLGKMRKV